MAEKLNIQLNTWGKIKTDRTKDIQRKKLIRATGSLQQNTFEYIFYLKNTEWLACEVVSLLISNNRRFTKFFCAYFASKPKELTAFILLSLILPLITIFF
jgi:hypothetical protein